MGESDLIRVLHIFNIMNNGGIEHYVMERYRLIDRTKIQFDFLIKSKEPGYFDKEIEELGGKVFHTVAFDKHPIRSFFQVVKIVRKNHYNIVHRHTGNAIGYLDLWASKLGGARNLIIHSHNNSAEKIRLHNFAKRFLAIKSIRLACSESAGKWLYGDKPFQIMKNAIDISKFKFNAEKRSEIRRKYNITDAFVVGHIGRFDYQKNHDYLIDIFYELKKLNKKAKLICIGEGHLMNGVKDKIASLGLNNDVIFTGTIYNVSEVMNTFDVFCLPSRYEGFPFVLLESQCNGLFCVVSNRVSTESNLTGCNEYLSLEDNPLLWAKSILELKGKRNSNSTSIIRREGYDINDSVKFLESFYLNLG